MSVPALTPSPISYSKRKTIWELSVNIWVRDKTYWLRVGPGAPVCFFVTRLLASSCVLPLTNFILGRFAPPPHVI